MTVLQRAAQALNDAHLTMEGAIDAGHAEGELIDETIEVSAPKKRKRNGKGKGQSGLQMEIGADASDVDGRKDSGGQAQSITTPVVTKNLGQLTELYKKMDLSKDNFSECIKAVAKESGYNADVVKKLVVAKCDGSFRDQARKASQLALIFSEIDE